MAQPPDALWINVNPPLQEFDRPLLKARAQHTSIAQWEYAQTPDEPNSLETALVLLHDYLKHQDRPIHLLGYGAGGLLALTDVKTAVTGLRFIPYFLRINKVLARIAFLVELLTIDCIRGAVSFVGADPGV